MAPVHTELGKLRLRPGDIELTAQQLRLTPLFADASDAVMRRLGSLRTKGAVLLRHYRAGEVVCRQGEAGWTAFYIMRDLDVLRIGIAPDGLPISRREVSGPPSVSIDQLVLAESQSNRVKAEVSITPAGSMRPPSAQSLFARVKQAVIRSKQRKKTIFVDGSADVVEIDDGSRVGSLREGELFGEMSCFNHTPRSATVRTIEDCYMLELIRNVLEDALENEAFREALNQLYRKRVLETHLASLPILEHAPPDALDELRQRAELVTFQAGATIFREGDPGDAMYFVRLGTVKLIRGGMEGRVLAYRSRGEWIGVGSMLSGHGRQATCVAHDSRTNEPGRSQRSMVAGRVELVRLSRALFDDVCRTFPGLHDAAKREAEQRSVRSLQPGAMTAVENHAGSLGLLQAEKLMLIDLDRCTRCDECVRACADTHDGIPLMSRSGTRFGPHLIPDTCRQCLDPVCLLGCPVGSIHRGKTSEIVIEDWCIGCGLCAEQCPYDAITLVDGATRKAHVCDQCASLGGGTPMCVYACGHDAALRVDGRSFFTDRARRS